MMGVAFKSSDRLEMNIYIKSTNWHGVVRMHRGCSLVL